MCNCGHRYTPPAPQAQRVYAQKRAVAKHQTQLARNNPAAHNVNLSKKKSVRVRRGPGSPAHQGDR